MKIAVGMSGGLDSSVAALLLQRGGHELTGITMRLWPGEPGAPGRRGACFGPDEDVETARQVCLGLGIPFIAFDCAATYEEMVLRYFREEYLAGRTPNPCVRCNELVKFGMLPQLAQSSGLAFEYFATGHYARLQFDPGVGRFLLKKGVDSRKDQSYFLYRLTQDQLSRTLFPLGELLKARVRQIARDAELPVHDKPESQDFYSGNWTDIIPQPDREGEIVDSRGRVLGKHRGVWNYTIGQRKGLGIASSEPLYVIAIDAGPNRLVVGTEKETFRRSCLVGDCNWIARETLAEAVDVLVKIRSAAKPAGATISPLDGGKTKVHFAEPLQAVTPGQSAVFYQDDVVLGGGIIETAE